METKELLKKYNELLKKEIKMEKSNLDNKSIYEIICYYRLNELIKKKRISLKKGKSLTKLLDTYFVINRTLIDNPNEKKLYNKLIKIETILSFYHIIDEVDLMKFVKQDILLKTKRL